MNALTTGNFYLYVIYLSSNLTLLKKTVLHDGVVTPRTGTDLSRQAHAYSNHFLASDAALTGSESGRW